MNTGDFPARRWTLLLLALIIAGAMAAAIYTSVFASRGPLLTEENALKIVRAAHDYTYALRLSHKSIPPSIELTNLVALHYLKSEDIAAFDGMDARLTLVLTNNATNQPLLRVRTPEGGEFVLFEDGASQQTRAASP